MRSLVCACVVVCIRALVLRSLIKQQYACGELRYSTLCCCAGAADAVVAHGSSLDCSRRVVWLTDSSILRRKPFAANSAAAEAAALAAVSWHIDHNPGLYSMLQGPGWLLAPVLLVCSEWCNAWLKQ
jgi:hypothetical protein